jgi:DNA sulfur modification protein DndD
MILEKIIIKNFLPFKEETVVEFSTDSEKNITILLAENNVGKTSFLKAFIWCLYGTDRADDDNILNAESKIDLENGTSGNFKIVSVQLSLWQNSVKYIVTRTWRYTLQDNRRVKIDKDELQVQTIDNCGNTSSYDSDERQSTINSILPEDLSEYFFYEEKKFMEIGETKNIKNSVENFCGLTTLDTAVVDISRAINSLNAEMKDTNDSVLASLKIKKQNAVDSLTKAKNDLATAQSEKEYYDGKVKEENALLLRYAKDEQVRENYNKITNHIKVLTDEIPDLENGVIAKFNNNLFGYLTTNKAFSGISNILNTADNGESVETVRGVDVNTIDDIIKRGYCLCGTKISDRSEAYEHLKREREKVPPNNLSGSVKNFKDKLELHAKYSSSYISDVDSAYTAMRKKRGELGDAESDKLELKKDFANTTDTSEIRDKITEYESQAKSKQNRIDTENHNIGLFDAQCAELETKIKAQSKKNEHNNEIQRYKDYLAAVMDKIQSQLDDKRTSVRNEMNVYVSKFFSQLYHGNLKLEISDDYSIVPISDYGGQTVSTKMSTGTNDVKNFAFVFGLEQLAKDKLNFVEDEEKDNSSEPYPLVLDGPFSHVDEGHMENLCNLIPQVSNQVIIAVSRKDWNLTSKYLDKKIGKSYSMQVITETNTKISNM